jgi:hypothetical protein
MLLRLQACFCSLCLYLTGKKKLISYLKKDPIVTILQSFGVYTGKKNEHFCFGNDGQMTAGEARIDR